MERITFKFYGVTDAVRRMLSCKDVPCSGHPVYNARAVSVSFPKGTKILSRPTKSMRCAPWRWELPDGSTVSCDYYHKIGRFCSKSGR